MSCESTSTAWAEGLQTRVQVNNADFSFAGIKTAVRRAIEAEAPGPATDANLQVLADTCGP